MMERNLDFCARSNLDASGTTLLCSRKCPPAVSRRRARPTALHCIVSANKSLRTACSSNSSAVAQPMTTFCDLWFGSVVGFRGTQGQTNYCRFFASGGPGSQPAATNTSYSQDGVAGPMTASTCTHGQEQISCRTKRSRTITLRALPVALLTLYILFRLFFAGVLLSHLPRDQPFSKANWPMFHLFLLGLVMQMECSLSNVISCLDKLDPANIGTVASNSFMAMATKSVTFLHCVRVDRFTVGRAHDSDWVDVCCMSGQVRQRAR